MKIKDAKRILKNARMTFKKTVGENEYRVQFKEDRDDTCAYYTDNVDDAVNTELKMRLKREELTWGF
jgi:hypothetical protein